MASFISAVCGVAVKGGEKQNADGTPGYALATRSLKPRAVC